MTTEVKHQPDRERYVIEEDGAVIGIAQYEPDTAGTRFTHTEVDPSRQDEGVGSALVQGALDDVRSNGGAVIAECPFVAAWLDEHPDYQDLKA